MKYAVVEWEGGEEDCEGWVGVIAKNQDKETADLLVRYTPAHMSRQVITMLEHDEMKTRDEYVE